jgi:monoterpene epsilon-lactone hydrolase
MNMLRDAIGRSTLFPALHLLRRQLRQISDPLRLREMAARFDAMGRRDRQAHSEPVIAGAAPASWIDMPGVRADRVVLYLHGGAFVTETPNFHGALLARICRAAGARGLMLGYRLAPEHRYPAALDDCLGAYRWLLAQGVAADRIVVAGDSAGGNLTLALLLRARDEALPLPAGAVALSPVTDFTFSGASVQRNEGVDDMFSAQSMDALVPIYLPRPELCTDPYVSPVFGDYAGLPPLLLVVGSTELLLDDSVRVAQRCAGAQLQVWHGMPHVFPGFAFLPEARKATEGIGRFMRDCLQPAVRAASAGGGPAPAEATIAGDTVPADEAASVTPVGDLPASSTPIASSGPAPAALPGAPPQPPAPHGPDPAHAPRGFGVAAWLYLALTLMTGAASLSLLLAWPALVLANPVVWAATAAALVFIVAEAPAVGWRRVPWCIAATLLLGPGCGLSLFLFLRAAHPTALWRAQRAARPPVGSY